MHCGAPQHVPKNYGMGSSIHNPFNYIMWYIFTNKQDIQREKRLGFDLTDNVHKQIIHNKNRNKHC